MLLIHNLHVEQAEVLQQLLSIIAKRADDLSMVEKNNQSRSVAVCIVDNDKKARSRAEH
jgi:phage anti-repressor protein